MILCLSSLSLELQSSNRWISQMNWWRYPSSSFFAQIHKDQIQSYHHDSFLDGLHIKLIFTAKFTFELWVAQLCLTLFNSGLWELCKNQLSQLRVEKPSLWKTKYNLVFNKKSHFKICYNWSETWIKSIKKITNSYLPPFPPIILKNNCVLIMLFVKDYCKYIKEKPYQHVTIWSQGLEVRILA